MLLIHDSAQCSSQSFEQFLFFSERPVPVETVLFPLPDYVGYWDVTSSPYGSRNDSTPGLGGFLGGGIKASASNAGDLGSIPESGRSPGEGNGNPLQYSCLENPMDGEAW